MRLKKWGIVLLFLVFSFASLAFFYWSSLGYLRAAHIQIRDTIVDHPEFIPTAWDISLISAGHNTIIADYYWLSAIQYIGSNAIGAEYKKYLAAILNLVTDLSPKFEYPYEIGLLLLPDYNERYEKLSKEEQDSHIKEAIALGEKGISRGCDATKIERIKKENDLIKLSTDDLYKNPCSDFMIPYYMGYVYYWSLHNPVKSSEYYKIASANTDSVAGARTMAALMQGKGGDREKAILMFLSLAEGNATGEKASSCQKFSQELGSVLLQAFSKKMVIDGEFVQRVEKIRQEIVHSLNEWGVNIKKNPIDFDNYCSVPLSKAVRELNLYYVTLADNKYFAATGKHARTAKHLQDLGYLPYLPKDFQTTDEDMSIIYQYDAQVGQWDYTSGKY